MSGSNLTDEGVENTPPSPVLHREEKPSAFRVKSVTYNINKLKDPAIRNTYSVELNKKLALSEHQNEKPTDSWNRIAIACIKKQLNMYLA